MIDPFAAALGALFNAPGSAAATYYVTATGAVYQTRIIWTQGSNIGGVRSDVRVADTNHFDVMRSVVSNPAKGDVVETSDPLTGLPLTLKVNGAAIMDAEGMTWTCPAEPS